MGVRHAHVFVAWCSQCAWPCCGRALGSDANANADANSDAAAADAAAGGGGGGGGGSAVKEVVASRHRTPCSRATMPLPLHVPVDHRKRV